MTYPEIKPEADGPLKSFTFNLDAASHASREHELEIEALEIRLKRIVDKFQVSVEGGERFPLIDKILNITHNKTDLKGLAIGLERASEIVERLDELKEKHKVLELAKKDPNWFAFAFADFTSDLDIDRFLESNTTSSEE